MRRHFTSLAGLLLLAPLALSQGTLQHHDLKVTLEPEAHTLVVHDSIQLPAGWNTGGTTFSLDKNLEILTCTPKVTKSEPGEDGTMIYTLDPDSAADWIELAYSGTFDFGLSSQKEEYSRGMRDTRGTIGPEGVYLAGESHWVRAWATT